MEESKDEEESKKIHINDNDSSLGYFGDVKADFKCKTMQQVREVIH